MEGNVGAGLYADLFHGTHNFITIFRNRYDGNEPNNGNAVTGHANPLLLFPFSRFFNVIGNVLGTSSYHTNYIGAKGSSGSTQDHSIYVIGTGPVTCCQAGDPLVQSTLMLWGNYDTVNNTVRFVNAEVPSGIANFPNPVPSSQVLPNSFYLNAKPSWFGSVPWPPIGPDVASGNIPNVGGHAYRIPAQDCYTTRMFGPADGTGSALSFNASSCYGTGGPGAPTNLRIIR